MSSHEPAAPLGLGPAAARVIFGRGSAALLSIAFVAYIARALPKTAVALIGIQASAVMIVRACTELGLRYCVIREGAPLIKRGELRRSVEEIIGPCSWARLTAIGCAAGIYLALGVHFLPWFEKTFPEFRVDLALLALTAHLCMKCVQAVLMPIFFVTERFGSDSFLDSSTALLEKVFAIAFYLLFGINFFFVGFALGPIVTISIAVFRLRDVLRFFSVKQFRREDILAKLRAYRPQFLRQFLRQGVREFDRILIVLMLPIAETAHYHVARQGSSYLQHVVRAVADPLTVRLSDSPDHAQEQRLKRTYFLFTLGTPIVAAVLGPWLMALLGGAEYVGAWHVLVVLCISYVFYALSEYQLSVLTILGQGDEPIWADALSASAGLASTFILIEIFGQYGMAWGQLIAFAVLWLGGIRVTRQLLAKRRAAQTAQASLQP